ncbi:MAG: ArsA family ATPase [Synechococcales bacterium]|nr:ArsA family ATPase [Synechococcales bacterium]
MALLLTYLGKGGVGRTTVAIAAARHYAQQGKRVLFASSDASPAVKIALGAAIGSEPTAIAPNLEAVQFLTTVLLEQAWEELKQLEARYIRTPFFKNVYGQELGILPGMDTALALNALRVYSRQYEVVVYDSPSSPELLRMMGTPEVVSWYVRRFRQVFADSDLAKNVMPLVQPILPMVLDVAWAADNFAMPTNQLNELLEQGKATLSDPQRTIAYLVTTADQTAIATAQYLWGSAQQVGLTVGGVFARGTVGNAFDPLPLYLLPEVASSEAIPATIAPLVPEVSQALQVPSPIRIDAAAKKVYLFLPTFDKKQVKLTQYGPEITIEAGDQRRNIFLPPELSGLPVTGAKFQEGYLIISF